MDNIINSRAHPAPFFIFKLSSTEKCGLLASLRQFGKPMFMSDVPITIFIVLCLQHMLALDVAKGIWNCKGSS